MNMFFRLSKLLDAYVSWHQALLFVAHPNPPNSDNVNMVLDISPYWLRNKGKYLTVRWLLWGCYFQPQNNC
jgi:hypothetical protein